MSVNGIMTDPVRWGLSLILQLTSMLTWVLEYTYSIPCQVACRISPVAADSPASPLATFQTLVVALVLLSLDYGNGVLVCLPAYLVRRIQSVLHTSATSFIYVAPITSLTIKNISYRDRIPTKLCTCDEWHSSRTLPTPVRKLMSSTGRLTRNILSILLKVQTKYNSSNTKLEMFAFTHFLSS